jgi:hypothetical protein
MAPAPRAGHRLMSTVRAVVGATCLLSVALVAGCSESLPAGPPTPSASASAGVGGQSLAQTRQQLASCGCVTNASVKVNQTLSGLNTHRRIWLEATTDRNSPDERRDLVEYLLSLGWSINDFHADEGVSVRLHTSPQVVVGGLLDSSWPDVQYRSAPESFMSVVVVSRPSLEQELGAWPGPRPRPFLGAPRGTARLDDESAKAVLSLEHRLVRG